MLGAFPPGLYLRCLEIHKEKSNKMQQCIKILLFHEAQHVSGDTPPIIRNLKLHWQPLVHRLHVQQPSMYYEKPEAASAVLGS